jgi:hypothetical protein
MAKVLGVVKFRRLGNILVEPSDCDKSPLRKILYFVRGVGLVAE